jgi:CHAT domain-containing protein/Tfp pilus assembly protein PilF
MLLVVSVVASATEMTLRQTSVEKSSKAAKTIQTGVPSQCQDSDGTDQVSNQETGDKRKPPTSEFLRSCADAFRKEGGWTKAEKYYQSALLQDRHAGGQNLAEALDLTGIGHAEVRLGNLVKAEDYYQQAVAIQGKLAPDGLSMARSLNGLGEATEKWGDVAKAERYFHQAQTILRKLGHHGELDFAISLNGLGSAAQQRGNLGEAEALHRRALSMQEQRTPQTLDVADTLDYLGRISYLHGHYQRAEDYYSESLALRKQFAGGGLDIVWSINGLGNVAYSRGELAKAEEFYRRGLGIAERFAPDSLVIGKFLGNLSLVSYNHGDLAAAETYQRQALTIRNRLAPDGLDVAISLRNLGDIFDQRGELAKAEEYSSRSLTVRQRLIPGSAAVASSLSKLGVIADQRGDLIKAEEYYLRALDIQKNLDPAGLAVSNTFLSLGALAQQRRDLGGAEKYYRWALAIKQRIVPGSLGVASSFIYLGLLADDRGDHARAEYYARKALAIIRKIAPGSISFAGTMNFLGQIKFHRSALDEAESYLRQALSIQQKLNPDSLEVASSLHFLGMILRARRDLFSAENLEREALAIQEKLAPVTLFHAEILASLGAIMRARQQWDSAAQLYKRSVDSLENQLSHLGGGNAQRSGLRASYAHFYEEYASLLMAQGHAELAFEVSERWRARSLLEMLAEARINIHKGVDEQLLERELRLEKSRAARSSERIQLLAHSPSQQQLAAADKEIDELSRQYEELQEQIRQKSPEYAALTNPRTLTVKEVQQLLDAGSLLLEYSLGKESSFLWAISSEGFSAYELPKRAEIERHARLVYRLLIAPGQMPKGETQAQRRARLEKARKSYWRASASLSRIILGPASADLKDKRLLIVSDGSLQYIPFSALPTPDLSVRGSERVNTPLIMQHEIANLPSASVLAALREQAVGRKEPTGEVVVLADAVFSKEDTRVKKENKHQKSNPVVISEVQREAGFLSANAIIRPASNSRLLNRRGIHLTRLPFSREEAKDIMAAAPMRRSTVALDFAANLDLATSPKLAQYRIVHFATHGILDSKNPELSGLVFSMVDRSGRPQNGFLDLQSIYNLNLPVDLVVLSACETALGKEIQGEGLVGLTRGFMYAGALQVMASLWKIDDARTAELMKYFYKGMEQERLTPAAALRKAQIYAWTQRPWGLPFSWAAFEVQGD